MTRADRVLIALIALVALIAWPLTAVGSGRAADTVVISGPQGSSSVPLGEDAELKVSGAMGTVVVKIVQGEVRVVESGCPDQTCVKTGALSAAGSIVACVPNGVVVRVGGGDGDGLDARIR